MALSAPLTPAAADGATSAAAETPPQAGVPAEPHLVWCRRDVVTGFAVTFLSGFLFGCALGFIPTYMAMNTLNEECHAYRSQATCEGARRAECTETGMRRSVHKRSVHTQCASVHRRC